MKSRDWKDATDLVAQPVAFGVGENPEVGHCLRSGGSKADKHESATYVVQPTVIHGTQDPCLSDIAFAQGRNSGQENVLVQPIAFSAKDYGADAGRDLSPTLRAMPHDASHANGGGQLAVALPIPFDTTQITSPFSYSNPKSGDPCHPLAAGAHIPAVATSMAVTYSIMPMNSGKDYKAREVEVSQPIMAGGPVGGNQGGDYVMQSTAVRRLTPRECERLQGFPDDYTAIPKAADGPRYKALGNSMAVPVMAWIGKRIADHLQRCRDDVEKFLREIGA
jgi:DNA (cytosine-5)-methyltransferase 1